MHPIAIIPGLPGGPEVLVILLIGLLLFGGRLPEVGKSIGKSIIEFRKGLRGLKEEVGLDKEMRSIQRDLDDASRATAVGAWPDGADQGNPWAELDQKAAATAETTDSVIDTEVASADDEKADGEIDGGAEKADSQAESAGAKAADATDDSANEQSGPIARGEIADASEAKKQAGSDKSA